MKRTNESESKNPSTTRRQNGVRQNRVGSTIQSGPVALLHKAAGNQALQELRENGDLQAKLEVSDPDDEYEREAERVAEKMMRMSEPEAEMDRGEVVHRTVTTGGKSAVDRDAEERIRSLRGGGQPLRESTRSFFEPHFGRDFGDVRVHTGPEADEAAQSINAEAFTTGTEIVFSGGTYEPETSEGKKLLAHELTHVVQQGDALSQSSGLAHRQAVAQKTDDPPTRHYVREGETLWGIAERYYGDGSKYPHIQREPKNDKLEEGQSLIKPGWELFIPGLDEDGQPGPGSPPEESPNDDFQLDSWVEPYPRSTTSPYGYGAQVGRVYFPTAEHSLDSNDKRLLQQLTNVLEEELLAQNIQVTFAGFADRRGDWGENMELASRRAESVASQFEYLKDYGRAAENYSSNIEVIGEIEPQEGEGPVELAEYRRVSIFFKPPLKQREVYPGHIKKAKDYCEKRKDESAKFKMAFHILKLYFDESSRMDYYDLRGVRALHEATNETKKDIVNYQQYKTNARLIIKRASAGGKERVVNTVTSITEGLSDGKEELEEIVQDEGWGQGQFFAPKEALGDINNRIRKKNEGDIYYIYHVAD